MASSKPIFLFHRFKIKLKGHHFDTSQVVETESQAVLNILTEHDSQDEFKNGRRAGNGEFVRKGTTSRVMMTTGPKVIF
jgi:hypothetical protein